MCVLDGQIHYFRHLFCTLHYFKLHTLSHPLLLHLFPSLHFNNKKKIYKLVTYILILFKIWLVREKGNKYLG